MHYRSAIMAWLALLLLLGLSLMSAWFLSGPLQMVASLSWALAMAAVILVAFMGLRAADGMLRLFAVGGVLWLALLMLLTILDVITR